ASLPPPPQNRGGVARGTPLGGGLPSFPKGCPLLFLNRLDLGQPRGVGILSHLTPLH
ncbi:hypothetical protein NPIL_263391, partial [Nephila pilipes]